VSISCACCVLSDTGLCVGQFSCPEESCRLWCVCHREASTLRRFRPIGAVALWERNVALSLENNYEHPVYLFLQRRCFWPYRFEMRKVIMNTLYICCLQRRCFFWPYRFEMRKVIMNTLYICCLQRRCFFLPYRFEMRKLITKSANIRTNNYIEINPVNIPWYTDR
jgi:hypothetical protein